MNNESHNILEKIVAHKKEEVQRAKKRNAIADFLEKPKHSKRNFYETLLQAKHAAIIAEIKKASPSKGILREDFNVREIAICYEANQASCISVLTDEHFFKGHLENLKIARKACQLPILRKDFIVDSFQIYESYYHQADCILLIAAILDDYEMHDFCQLAEELELEVLVESHDEQELERALKLPTPLIGINNRSLKNFKTDLQTSVNLYKKIPKDRLCITESGIHSHEDIQYMQAHGINSFLIGESLMRSEDIGWQLRHLIYGK
jgi:indole-3-glycerol phosphate synthase